MSQKKEQDMPAEAVIDEIEVAIRRHRGKRVSRTPWEYNIPTAYDLQNMRERCELSVEEMAERIDYSPDTIRNYESGHPPGRQFIQTALRLFKLEWPDEPRSLREVNNGR